MTVEVLLKRGANSRTFNLDGKTPLHSAAPLTQGNQVKKSGYDPIVWQVQDHTQHGRWSRVKDHLDKGFDPFVTDWKGRTLLHMAAYLDKNDVQKESTAAVDEMAAEGVKMLLSKGAYPSRRDKDGNTPLHLAVIKGHSRTAEAILERYNAPMNEVNNEKESLLHLATHYEGTADEERDGPSCLSILLGFRDTKVDLQDSEGRTPLHVAAWLGDVRTAETLLKDRHNLHIPNFLNIMDEEGRTAFMSAVYYRNLEVAKLLLEKGADIHFGSARGPCSQDQRECELRFLEAVPLLLDMGVSPNITGYKRRSLLNVAAEVGDWVMAEKLLENKADVNHQTADGRTSLHLAAIAGSADVVYMLIEHKADVRIKDKSGRIAESYTKDETIMHSLRWGKIGQLLDRNA